MPYDCCDVVGVHFPFTNQSASKQRPAAIVGRLAYNGTKPDVVIVAITRQSRPSSTLGEVWLNGWQAAGLLKPSAIKPIFATLERQLIIRRLGRLSEPDCLALNGAVTLTLGLGPTAPPGLPS